MMSMTLQSHLFVVIKEIDSFLLPSVRQISIESQRCARHMLVWGQRIKQTIKDKDPHSYGIHSSVEEAIIK